VEGGQLRRHSSLIVGEPPSIISKADRDESLYEGPCTHDADLDLALELTLHAMCKRTAHHIALRPAG
jgi:hypothetical protein